MKKWIKLSFVFIRNTFIIIILLEIFLYFLFKFNDKRRNLNNIEFKITSGAYPNTNPETIKNLYVELNKLESEWAPYMHYKLKKFDGKYHNIDKNGFRKTVNLNLKNEENTFKIFCFGGSTILGTGVSDINTIPSFLSRYIFEEFPKLNIKIFNFGCHGYTRSIENIQLQRELIKDNKPDMVIFYDGVNEVVSTHENNEVGLPGNAFYRKKVFKISSSYSRKIGLFYHSSNIKRLITFLQKKVFKTKHLQVTIPKDLSSEIAQEYLNYLKISKSLGVQYNFDVYNFLQPMIYLNKPLTKNEEIMANNNRYFEKLYQSTYKSIRESQILKQDTSFIDISSIFEKDQNPIYTDFCHIAARGNDSIAKVIFSYIQSSIVQENESKTTNIQTETLQNSQ